MVAVIVKPSDYSILLKSTPLASFFFQLSSVTNHWAVLSSHERAQ